MQSELSEVIFSVLCGIIFSEKVLFSYIDAVYDIILRRSERNIERIFEKFISTQHRNFTFDELLIDNLREKSVDIDALVSRYTDKPSYAAYVRPLKTNT